MRLQRPAAAAWLAAAAVARASDQSTVSVYLPEYSEKDWAALRGSILSSDESATAYTVFCADQAPGCQIAGKLPFVFTEGPETLVYSGTSPGTLTAGLECALDAKTAATCTGSSSFGSNYRQGSLTGPTTTTWTSTFGPAEVTWGVLTLSTPGPLPGTTDIDGTVLESETGVPSPTSGANRPLDRGRLIMASLGAALSGVLLFA